MGGIDHTFFVQFLRTSKKRYFDKEIRPIFIAKSAKVTFAMSYTHRQLCALLIAEGPNHSGT